MFGYATDETPELLPMTILLAHKLNKEMALRRRDGSMAWLRPDSSTPAPLKLCSFQKLKSLLNIVRILPAISSLSEWILLLSQLNTQRRSPLNPSVTR